MNPSGGKAKKDEPGLIAVFPVTPDLCLMIFVRPG